MKMPASTLMPFQHVEVVAAVRLGDVAIGVGEVPLAARRARVVARRHLGVHAELRHEAAAHVVVVEVAADAELLHLNLLVRPLSDDPVERVIVRMVEVVDVVHVDADLRP